MPWYKHWWGIIILFLLAAFFAMALFFVWLVFQEVEKLRVAEEQKAFTRSDLPPPGSKPLAEVATTDDPSWGPRNAKVTIVEFSDFQCPYCRQAFPIIRELEALYKNKVRLIYRDFPIESIHQFAFKAAEAAQCAHEQGRFWPYHDKLFQNQDRLDIFSLKNYARQVGLDETRFDTCLDSFKYSAEVSADLQDGVAAGVTGTPSWFINGRLVEGVISLESFKRVIEQELAKP